MAQELYRKCRFCGEFFKINSKDDKRYCNVKCRKAYFHKLNPTKQKEYSDRFFDKFPEKKILYQKFRGSWGWCE